MSTWPVAFAVTLAVEAALLLALFARTRGVGRTIAAAALGNAVTHPVVWFVLPHLLPTYASYLIVAEAWAVLGEAPVLLVLLRPRPRSLALAASAAANLASYVVGLVARA